MMMLADWSNTMYDAMEVTSIAIVIFFVLFYIIVVVIVLNLFLAVILDAYSVQDQSTEEVEMEIDSATPGQPKKRVLVTKRSVQWKRELLRGELPELKKQELAQLSKGNDIDLVSLYVSICGFYGRLLFSMTGTARRRSSRPRTRRARRYTPRCLARTLWPR